MLTLICLFEQLEGELSQTISRQQEILGLDNSDWQHRHVPREKALQDIGLGALASKLRRFQGDHAEALSGRAGVAEVLEWRLVKAKRQPPQEAEAVRTSPLPVQYCCG